MKELVVPEQRYLHFDVLKLTEVKLLPGVGGKGGGEREREETHCFGRIWFSVYICCAVNCALISDRLHGFP